MSPDTANTLLGAIVATALTIPATLLVQHWSRAKSEIIFQEDYFPIARRSSPGIKILAKSSLLTGTKDEREPTWVPVDDVTAYWYEFRNDGNQTIKAACVEIALEPEAKIFEFDTIPKPGIGYELRGEIDATQRNTLSVQIPYLNIGDSIQIRLFAVAASEPRAKYVHVRGEGIQTKRSSTWRTLAPLVLLCLFLFSSFWLFTEGAERLPEVVFNAIGAKVESTSILSVVWRPWHVILWALLVGVASASCIRSMYKRDRMGLKAAASALKLIATPWKLR